MDAKQTAQRGGEVSMVENKAPNDGQVVVEIPETKDAKGSSPKASESCKQSRVDSAQNRSAESTTGFSKSVPISCPSPEISGFSPSPNKPPKVPTTSENLTRRRSLARSVYSKPKSRFGEQPYSSYGNMFDENGSALQEQIGAGSPYRNSFNVASPTNKMSRSTTRTVSITPKTPLMASPGHDEDEEIYKKVKLNKEKHRRVKTKVLVELIAFVCILGCLVASLTAKRLKTFMVWGLEFWKWWVLVMVIFSGMLVTNWFMHVVVFLIERNFLLRKKVLYFVHGLKKSVQILASNFHVNTFFDRIQESIFHQYVLQTLSGPALIEEAERVGRSPSTGQLSFRSTKKSKGKKEKKVIDMGKLHKMKQEKVSAWTMKVLVDAVMSSGLSTISNALDESVDDEGAEQADKEITNEMEATAAAYHIFRNVAQPGCKYIDEDDLMRFMIKEEVDLVFSPVGRRRDRKDRQKRSYRLGGEVILIVVTILVWLLLMGIATTKVLVFLSSQLLVAAFMFGNTCKTIFEAIIFVFVMHPFDVGDRCVIDGVTMMVEEMNILTTVFLKLNFEKVYYPNSVLATKPISNYYRSPDMGDSVEFSIDFMTPVEKIGMLKDKIKKYLEKNPQHWHANHNLVVKEIENVNKIKMGLVVFHTMNFQDIGEKTRRRTELVIEIKKIFEELNIRYNLLPQAVHLGQTGSETTNATNR
ncbi:hypothetical protein SLA2020_439220 [Shorea laevis]